VHIGRPKAAESDEEFLANPSSQHIIEALKMGLSLRQASRQAGVSINTVRKVKAVPQGSAIDLQHQPIDAEARSGYIGSLGGNYSIAYDINDKGQVVGASTVDDTTEHAFFYDSKRGGILDLNNAILQNSGYTLTSANGINYNGQIAATSYINSSGAIRAFLLTPTSIVSPIINIATFSPNSGPAGTTVIINGIGFTGATAVKFYNGSDAPFTINSGLQITTTVPPEAATGTLQVITPAGRAGSRTEFQATTP